MYDLDAMHERALRAIFALQRNRLEVAARMGIDTSIPIYKRLPLPPTEENISRAAEVLGVSVGWLTTGVPETQTDLFVLRMAGVDRSVILRDNKHCRIVVHNFPDPRV